MSLPRITILDRYIFREFVVAFVGVMAFCTLLILVAMVFEKFGEMSENKTPPVKAVLYFLYSLPTQVLQIVPIGAMLAVLFAIGALAWNNEILACLTNGITSLRLAVPVAFGGLLIFAGMFFVSEKIAPPLQQEANFLRLRYVEAKSEAKITTEKEVFARGDKDRIYLMDAYSIRDSKMMRPQVYDLLPDKTTARRRIDAESGTFIRNDSEAGLSEWRILKAHIWEFDDSGTLKDYHYYDQVTLQLEENLAAVLAQRKKPEEMNFAELERHIGILSERGQPHFAMLTDLILKVTFPLGVLAILVIGFSYAVRTRAGNAMSAFGYGISWAFAYYLVTAVTRAFGHSGSLSPMVAGILPMVVFAVAAVHYFRRSYRWFA